MRKLFLVLALGVLAAALVTTSGSAAAQPASAAPCGVQHPSDGTNSYGSAISAMGIANSNCAVHNTGNFANGVPPLIWWGGPVMGTKKTGAITVTPIFWNPPTNSHGMTRDYKQIIARYLANVAADSGLNSNVYSTATEYYDSIGSISYNIKRNPPIDDTYPLPANGCTVAQIDRTNIYADGSGYNACLDDAQITGEIRRVVTANGLPKNDYQHMYVIFLPKHVESCFFAGSSETNNACTINHLPTAAYCAYHSMIGDTWPDFGTVYSNMPYPIYSSQTGYTCGSDAGGGTLQSPNHNLDADTVVSPTSHEIMESITDPNVFNGWYDSYGFENGDECAYVYGTMAGSPGQQYNQVINGVPYLTQEEFSNKDFADTGGGCVPSESAVG